MAQMYIDIDKNLYNNGEKITLTRLNSVATVCVMDSQNTAFVVLTFNVPNYIIIQLSTTLLLRENNVNETDTYRWPETSVRWSVVLQARLLSVAECPP